MDSQKDRHEAGTCKGTILGLGAKTDFASDDKRSEGALGKVIVSRDVSIVCPVIKAMSVLDKYLLKRSDCEMVCRLAHGGYDSSFALFRSSIELFIGYRQ